MPVFPSQDLYGKKICESYQQLLQIYDNDVVLDGSGSQKQFLNVTASYALNCNCDSGSLYASVSASFVSSSTWVFTHNLQTRPVLVQAYDYSFNQIIPSSIVLTTDNIATLTFPVSESGFVIATRSGLRTISGSTDNGCCLQTGSTYPITASWALNALNGGTKLQTGSYYPITSSWVLTASYALNCNCDTGSLYASVSASFVSSSTWIFTHNLKTRPVLVQAYDYSFNQIIPSSIVLTTDNVATLTFPVSESGFAIATRSGLRTISGSTDSNCCLQTGSTYPITASWALNVLNGGTSLYTGSTYPITSSWALSASFALTASYIGDSVVGTFVSSSTWTFNHNLEARPVVIQAYDINYNQIVPQDIVLVNDNTAILSFPISESGFAIATRSGFRSVVTGTPMYTGSYYPITSSWAVNTQTSSYIQVTGVSYPVRRIYNNYIVVRTTDYTILCDATSGEFNVKLPNPVGNTNIYNIKKIDTTGHRINLTVTNSSYIDYELTQSIAHKGTNITVQSDGTNQYWIL